MATVTITSLTSPSPMVVSVAATVEPAASEVVADVKAKVMAPADVPANATVIPDGAVSLNHEVGTNNWSFIALTSPVAGAVKCCVWPIIQTVPGRAMGDVTVEAPGGPGGPGRQSALHGSHGHRPGQ